MNRLSEEKLGDLRRCLEMGMGTREISGITGMARNSIIVYRKKWGIAPNGHGYRAPKNLSLEGVALRMDRANTRLEAARKNLAAAQLEARTAEIERDKVLAECQALRVKAGDMTVLIEAGMKAGFSREEIQKWIPVIQKIPSLHVDLDPLDNGSADDIMRAIEESMR